MSSVTPILVGAAQVGLGAIMVRPRRSIGPFTAMVTIEENHQDEMEITDHPVETGAAITDHAYKLPSVLTIKAGWSNSRSTTNPLTGLANAVSGTVTAAAGIANAAAGALGLPSLSGVTGNDANSIKDIYQKFLTLQENRTLIDVYTGKRSYKNMLVKGIQETTNVDTENALILTITLRQVIIVSTQTITLANSTISATPSALKNAAKNSLVTQAGEKQLLPVGALGGGAYGLGI